jgi:hypothetical protein
MQQFVIPPLFRAHLLYTSRQPGDTLVHPRSLGWRLYLPGPNVGSLGYFVKRLPKYIINIFVPVLPSVCPHGTAVPPPDRFLFCECQLAQKCQMFRFFKIERKITSVLHVRLSIDVDLD